MNWQKRIDRAEKRGEFWPTEHDLAQSWRTCAVGEHKGKYEADGTPGGFEYAPIDEELDRLGTEFGVAVLNDAVKRARILHAGIARRIAEVPA